jgi:hypothetical protein
VPAVPELPLVPDEPEVPALPLVPVVPELPDVPVVPLEPDVPVEPELPEVPVLPELPEVPDSPDVPDEPVVPDEPEVPDVPDEPEVPLLPEVPEVPAVPAGVNAYDAVPKNPTPFVIELVKLVATTVPATPISAPLCETIESAMWSSPVAYVKYPLVRPTSSPNEPVFFGPAMSIAELYAWSSASYIQWLRTLSHRSEPVPYVDPESMTESPANRTRSSSLTIIRLVPTTY